MVVKKRLPNRPLGGPGGPRREVRRIRPKIEKTGQNRIQSRIMLSRIRTEPSRAEPSPSWTRADRPTARRRAGRGRTARAEPSRVELSRAEPSPAELSGFVAGIVRFFSLEFQRNKQKLTHTQLFPWNSKETNTAYYTTFSLNFKEKVIYTLTFFFGIPKK